MVEFIIKEFPVSTFVGKVFQEGSIGLLYGESGIGKTTTAIKLLNEEGIEPILVDLDSNLSPEDMGTTHIPIDGYRLLKSWNGVDKVDVPDGKVIIVDTYSMVLAYLGDQAKVEEFLEYLCKGGKNTVVVIAHNKDIATKRDIPDVDEVWSNHLGFKLFLHEGKVDKLASSLITVKKLRGYKGPRQIQVRKLG